MWEDFGHERTKYKGNVGNQNLESSHFWTVESGIHAHGIQNPQRGIQNPRLSWITLHGPTLGYKTVSDVLICIESKQIL